jgi:two-component system, chemotaxis family, protein-glutamate methylesterase/glutaminase
MLEKKIKTLLIEDSGFMRIFLSDLLRQDSDIEVVGTANNGLIGVEKAKALRPDVVITDMVMPDYDGLYVVKTLIREMPVPIILLSSLDRTSPQIFDALKEGAFDFVDKPQQNGDLKGYPLLSKMVHEASLSDGKKLRRRATSINTSAHTFDTKLNYDIIAVGASTGGPNVIEYFLSNIPKNLAIPVIIAQHMPDRFIESFATRLNETTGFKVKVAAEGEILMPNTAYFAPGTSNIRLIRDIETKRAMVTFVDDVYPDYDKPSINCLFESVAKVFGSKAIAVIMTGMGKDGAEGMLRIKEKGGFTVGQDEATSVVYGMPKIAFDIGAASYQLAMKEIPGFVVSAL